LFIGSQITLHASSPRSVTLTQLRFTSFAVINLRRDLHPQECARAGRTSETARVVVDTGRAYASEGLRRSLFARCRFWCGMGFGIGKDLFSRD